MLRLRRAGHGKSSTHQNLTTMPTQNNFRSFGGRLKSDRGSATRPGIDLLFDSFVPERSGHSASKCFSASESFTLHRPDGLYALTGSLSSVDSYKILVAFRKVRHVSSRISNCAYWHKASSRVPDKSLGGAVNDKRITRHASSGNNAKAPRSQGTRDSGRSRSPQVSTTRQEVCSKHALTGSENAPALCPVRLLWVSFLRFQN